MYLELMAVSDATIDRLHADPPLVWQLIAPELVVSRGYGLMVSIT